MNLALYCTVAEAARLAGITDRQVRNALDDGRIVGQKVGSVWMVLRASAEGFQRQRAPKATKAPSPPRRAAARAAKPRRKR